MQPLKRRSPRLHTLAAMFALLVAVTATSKASAQSNDYQQWTAMFLNGNLESLVPRLSFWFDGHVRRSQRDTLVILRPALGVRIFKGLKAHVGYAWVPRWVDGGDRIDEHRIWQQLLWSWRPMPAVSVMARPRFEQRFRRGDSGVGLRFRLFARGDYRFSKTSPFLFAVWDELFIHLNEPGWGPEPGLDQNRIFLGPGIIAGKGWRAELGYLLVYQSRPSQKDNIVHAVAVNIFGGF
jgi:hypothetical protein